jgi:hypothetical protein
MLLQDHCEAVALASSRDEFQAALVRFAQELGFTTVSASTLYDRPSGSPEIQCVDNTPDAYRCVFEDRSIGRVDPVIQHVKHSSLPIVWDQATYVRAGRGDRWEIQAPHGYHTGIAMALHLPFGRHFLVGVDRDRALPHHRPDELRRMVADFTSVLMYAQDAAFRLMPRLCPRVEPRLDHATATEFLPLSSIGLPEVCSPLRLMDKEFSARLTGLGEGDDLSRSILRARLHKPIH